VSDMNMALEVRDLGVQVDRHRLLDGVSFDVAPGEWLFILGPNGAGKTTLMRAIAGLQPIASGTVRIAGHNAATLRARDRARLVALVPQTPLVPSGMRVIDYVLLGRTPHLRFFATEGRADLDAASAALDTLALGDLADRTVDSLSGGERQRVTIARALAQETPVLLLDEPTTSLDIGHQQDVLELVDGLRRARQLTVIATMHDLTLAGHYADRLVLLRGGRIVETGTANDVMTEENLMRYYGARVAVVDGPHGRVVVPYRAHGREVS